MDDLKNSTKAKAPVAESPLSEVLRLDSYRRRWRLLALVAVFFFLLTAFAYNQKEDTAYTSPHIAHIQIKGVIDDSLHQQNILEDIRKNHAAKAVLVYIDSPGGTMVGGINLHQALRRLAAEKPVVTVMGNIAASAGYMVSTAGDYVIANPGSLTGSIGVMMPLVDATRLADKIGIQSDEVVSGSLKMVTSPLYKRNDADQAYLKDTVMEMQTVFLDMVKERRSLSPENIETISDGRILTGVSAHRLKLVDALGDRNSARAWLEQNKNISPNIPLIDISMDKPKSFMETLMFGLKGNLFPNQIWQGILAIAH